MWSFCVIPSPLIRTISVWTCSTRLKSEQVDQCFVNIDYKEREFNEHVVITMDGYERIQS